MSNALDQQPGLTVVDPGLGSSLQDLGRFGSARLGISQGGALDLHAHCWANKLLGNPIQNATVEITIGRAAFRAETDHQLVLTGADMQAAVDGSPVEVWRTFFIERGQTLSLKAAPHGLRAYLGVAGGFQTEPVLGSVSTVGRNLLGGLHGSGLALQVGDILPAPRATAAPICRTPHQYIPHYREALVLRVIESGPAHRFPSEEMERFYQSFFTLTKESDRMGARLQGDPVSPPTQGIISEGIPLGAIQIPPDGQPIILLNDRQTLGGYPKLGCVARVDLPQLAQARPGTSVRFVSITLDVAQNEWRDFSRFFSRPL